MDVLEHQRQLLDHARQVYRDTPISDETARAYLATPRHRFVRRYREWTSPLWQDVTESNLDDHLATLYADHAIILFGDDDHNIQSTISQPSFVLRMLDLLQLQPGHTVLELGAGSGWNAALIAHLVGPTGRVYTLEIIPDMAERASASIAELGITNVEVIAADGSNGHAAGAPYDRIVFTAGAHDLPRPFYDQIKPRGLLLMVVKSHGDGDTLFLLEYVGDHFESRSSLSCAFVPMTGKHQLDHCAAAVLEPLRERTAMAAGFRLHIYPADRHLVPTGDQWIVRRQESQFLWSP
jgi:protein-L-isoaspartate(D-aspartate) O-methyltransferase